MNVATGACPDLLDAGGSDVGSLETSVHGLVAATMFKVRFKGYYNRVEIIRLR